MTVLRQHAGVILQAVGLLSLAFGIGLAFGAGIGIAVGGACLVLVGAIEERG